MRPPRSGSGGPGGVTRVFVGAGRAAGMRPGDLVGAITNEAGLRGGEIGAIQIADGFSLVEVPEAAADHVIRTLRGATIRGQKVTVRRERYKGPAASAAAATAPRGTAATRRRRSGRAGTARCRR
jgi:ATP-dependent RNA helicase DeaD